MAIYRKVSWKRAARFAKKNPTGRKRKAVRAMPQKRKLVKLIKSVTMKQCESKVKYTNWQKIEMNHNSFNLYNHLNIAASMPSQGTAEDQRIGDEINMSGFKLKIFCGQKGDRPNVNWRYFVLSVPKGASISYTNWFRVITGNVMLDDPNPDFVKVLKTGYWRPNQAGLTGTGDDEFTFFKTMWIPYRKNIKFGPGGAVTTHNDNDIYCCVFVFDAFGTLVTDNIAYCQMSQALFYRDP